MTKDVSVVRVVKLEINYKLDGDISHDGGVPKLDGDILRDAGVPGSKEASHTPVLPTARLQATGHECSCADRSAGRLRWGAERDCWLWLVTSTSRDQHGAPPSPTPPLTALTMGSSSNNNHHHQQQCR